MQLVYFALETPVLEQRCSPAARNMSPSSEDVIPSYQHLNLPDQLRLTDWLWLDRLKESKFSCCLQQLPYAGAEHVGFLPSTKTVLIRFFFFFLSGFTCVMVCRQECHPCRHVLGSHLPLPCTCRSPAKSATGEKKGASPAQASPRERSHCTLPPRVALTCHKDVPELGSELRLSPPSLTEARIGLGSTRLHHCWWLYTRRRKKIASLFSR